MSIQDLLGQKQSDVGHNAIVYTYPGLDLVDVICSSRPYDFKGPGWEDASRAYKPLPAPREKGRKSEGADMARSLRRATAQLRRLALANGFDYFVTLTLDGVKIDRYDGAAITKALNTWANHMVTRAGLAYILVPELHQDGAFHFHGFFRGDGLQVVDSGTIRLPGVKQPRRPRSEAERAEWLGRGGQVVYNLPQWKLGFSTALALYGEYPAAVGYVCKYLGKQTAGAERAGLAPGRLLGRWYFSGGGLCKPQKEYLDIDYADVVARYGGKRPDGSSRGGFEFALPGRDMIVVRTRVSRLESSGNDIEKGENHGQRD